MDKQDLFDWMAQPVTACDPTQLIDLKTIRIPHNAQASQRLAAYLNQSRNPYLFKSGDLIVKLRFSPGKADVLPTMEDCLAEGLCHKYEGVPNWK